MSAGLTAALGYAGRGWPVFPCLPGRKEPATPHGFKDATTDPGVIRAWWARWPAANVAIATGAPAVDVVDVDVKPNGSGFAAFNRAKSAGLLAGAVAVVGTRSGGLHVYFPGTAQGCGSLPRVFVDFKATGGYVLAPPSVVDGKPYVLVEERSGGRPVDWTAVRRLLEPPPVRSIRPTRMRVARGAGGLARWLARQPEGNRNAALFWAACRTVENGEDTEDNGRVLLDAATAAGLDEQEARRTLMSARRKVGGVA